MSTQYTVNQIIDTQTKYENIRLNFGKYNGKTLKEIMQDEKGQGYLVWLYGQFKNHECPSPTQKAIMLYTKQVFRL